MSMHPYIPHLLADIKAVYRNKDYVVEEQAPTSIEEELEEVERWVTEGEPEHSFGYYCGLNAKNFPPAEQLSDEDLTKVCDAFRQMLYSWHTDIALPDALPLPLRYQFMVGTLDEKFAVVNTGFITFDYCTGYAPDCPFKEFCPCLEFWNNKSGSILPF
jgi:hypothetical protein